MTFLARYSILESMKLSKYELFEIHADFCKTIANPKRLLIVNALKDKGFGVTFINAQTGWICAFLGRVIRTTNGGISWDTANTNTGGPLRDIQFLNAQTGWVCGDGGVLVKSTNGGQTWTEIDSA